MSPINFVILYKTYHNAFIVIHLWLQAECTACHTNGYNTRYMHFSLGVPKWTEEQVVIFLHKI